MKQNISELAETIYRIKQQPDVIIDRHFARVFKKAVVNEHKFYVPILRESTKTISPLLKKIGGQKYFVVFTDLHFVRIYDYSDAVPMTMFQILPIWEISQKEVYGITINPFHKEYNLEINRKNFANIWQYQA
ncbi:MAG: SseB family protein [Neisseriaceae bacterium]|nr:SseB family protein [Neisseriaceae bacterium]